MQLDQIDIQNVRNLSGQQLQCGEGLNIITGRNAAGKTAILEAIYLLSYASSFRTPRVHELIQHNKEAMTVSAQVLDEQGVRINTGIEKGRQSTRIRFNGNSVSKRSEQAQNIPLFSVSPETHQLLSGGPQARRHWLDWAMFHVEPDYMTNWREYYHALRQRNVLLRHNPRPDQFVGWDHVLARNNSLLRQARERYLEQLNRKYTEINRDHAPRAKLILRAPAQTENAFLEELKQDLRLDVEAGYTRTGAHREDVCFSVGGHDAARVLSRGQIKLLVLYLFISQALVFHASRGRKPIILIDDMCAELDLEARNRILHRIRQQGLQMFITATEPDLFRENGANSRWFHVEQGKITQVA